ncbi:MAG: hypothetical protein AB7S26_18735 [Sandaracinaceae bacterium]
MQRALVAVWVACVLGGCDPEDPEELDASVLDAAADPDAAGIDASGVDGGAIDGGGATDGGLNDAAMTGSDAGEFDGHIVRLANVQGQAMSVELCLYPDGIDAAPIRMMEALGRPAGLARFEVSARFAFTATRATVPVRVVDITTGDCDTPLYETAITSSRTRLLFVLATLSFTATEDEPPVPAAGDLWRRVFHEGGVGVLALIRGDGSELRPSPAWAEITGSGTLQFTNFDGVVLFSRPLTTLAGGAFSVFSLSPDPDTVYIAICDDRAPGADGLSECGATVRP